MQLTKTGLGPQADAALTALLQAAGLPEPLGPAQVLSARQEETGARLAALVRLGNGQAVVFKQRSGADTARKFAGLQEAYRLAGAAHAGHPRFGVPRLLAADAAAQAILIEHLPGRAAEQIIEADPASAAHVLRAAGEWLRAHHGALPKPVVAFNTKRPLHRLKTRAAEAEPPAPNRFRAFMRGLQDRAAALEGRALPEAVIHGDFTLGNLMLDGDRVYGIDFENPNASARERDLALLMVDYVTRFGLDDAVPEGALIRPDLSDALTGGYGAEADVQVLDFLVRLRLLHIWLAIPQDRAARSDRRERVWRGVRGAAERLGV
jgi:aminoglycoside phosphotransferase